MKRKVNYLGNRELLAEIHKSKTTYCCFLDDEAKNYDLILRDIKDIKEATIAQALQNRIDRLTRQAKDQLKADNASATKISAFNIDPTSIDPTTLVFRVMTYDHIPLDTERTRKAVKNSDNHIKVNFPPFKHYRLDAESNLVEVGKSHWANGLHNGVFSVTGGKLTNRLASQFMLLVERYSQKGNWRGYTYLDDMKGQALVQLIDAALKFDEGMSDNPFSYYTMIITNCFRGILNSEKRVSDIKNKIMVESGYSATFEKQAEGDVGGGSSE